jgi:hypothetical protein
MTSTAGKIRAQWCDAPQASIPITVGASRLEENDHLLAPQLLTQKHLLSGVHPMKLG